MKLLQQEKEKNPKIKLTRMLKAGVVFFLVVFFLEIWMVNRLSTYGYKISELQKTKAALNLENQILENLIAEQVSLSSMESRANELGFALIKNLEYIKSASLASVR